MSLKSIAAAFAVLLTTGFSAQAAQIRTIAFEATGIFTSGSEEVFGLLGIDPVDTVTGSFSFDTTAVPFQGPELINQGTPSETLLTVTPFLTFTAQVGPFTLNAAAPSTANEGRITISDGVADTTRDGFLVVSASPQLIAQGIFVEAMALLLNNQEDPQGDPSAGFLNGSEVPGADALNMASQATFALALTDGLDGLTNGTVRYGAVTFTELAVTPVPLPAALPLFAGGLGLLGLIGWRRKRAVA